MKLSSTSLYQPFIFFSFPLDISFKALDFIKHIIVQIIIPFQILLQHDHLHLQSFVVKLQPLQVRQLILWRALEMIGDVFYTKFQRHTIANSWRERFTELIKHANKTHHITSATVNCVRFSKTFALQYLS